MHSAMWPVDSSSSSSSLFFSFPLLYRLFHKKQPSASSSSAVASKRGNDISVYVRSTTEAEPRLAPDKQVVPSVFLHPSMFFLRHHSYANRASSYYPLFSFLFFFLGMTKIHIFFFYFFRGKKKFIGSYKLYYLYLLKYK